MGNTMTQLIIKNEQNTGLIKGTWYFIRHKSDGTVRTACRSSFTVKYINGVIVDPVIYMNDFGVSFDTHEDFCRLYDIIGPVNKIEAS